MPLRIVQSKQNARLKELRRALTFPGREGRGLAGIEGPNLIEEALKAGLFIPTVFAALPAFRAAWVAANGVPLREPLKPIPPALDHATTLPSVSVIVTVVLLM